MTNRLATREFTLAAKVQSEDAEAYRTARDDHDDHDDYRYNLDKPGAFLNAMDASVLGSVPAAVLALLSAIAGVLGLIVVGFRHGISLAMQDEVSE